MPCHRARRGLRVEAIRVPGGKVSGVGESLDDQLQMNRTTWSQLNDKGVRAGDALAIEAFFYAPDEGAANSLVATLEGRGWAVQLEQSTTGFMRKKVHWSAEASKKLPAVDLAALDALVRELDAAASRHGAKFDGWGTELPADLS